MAQLGLIYQLRVLKDEDGNAVAQRCGLGSKTEFSDHSGANASGTDVMQCWALLLSAGHLDGTFATERALLKVLGKESALKRAFLSNTGFHDDEAREFCKTVVEDRSLYDTHKAIAFFCLFRYCRGSDKPLVKTLIKVLKFYCLEDTDHRGKQENLRRLYRRIRSICYLGLDSLYAPVPMQLDLGSILHDLRELGPVLCSAVDAPFCRELDNFNELLSREIYFEPEVLLQHREQAQVVTDYLSDRYDPAKTDNLPNLQRHKISDMRKVLRELRKPIGSPKQKDYKRLLYLPVRPNVFFQPMASADKLENSLQHACRKRSVEVSVVPDVQKGVSHMAVGITSDVSKRDLVDCYIGLVRFLSNLVMDVKRQLEFPPDGN
jgi:hypothetical protein